MIVKFYDEEYKEIELYNIIPANKNFESELDFFFDIDDYLTEDCMDVDIDKAKALFLERFNRELTIEQIKKALYVTENGSNGQTIDRYCEVATEIGYNVEHIGYEPDLEIIIKEY